MKTAGLLVPITDATELQNLLDDFSPYRPELNVYGVDAEVWANAEQLHMWRNNPELRITREDAREQR